MSEIKALEEFGLTETEAKVYLALLEEGSTLAGPIIKKTALHRGTTYQILQRLIEKGLVSYVIKSGKRYFDAISPERFIEILKDKQEQMALVLPSLLQKKEMSKQKQEVNVYSGRKGIKTILEKMLEELKGKGYLDFGVSGLFRQVMGAYWDVWQKKKKKYKIKSKCIFNEELRDSELVKDYYGNLRFHSSEFKSLTDTIIYEDKVVLFIWSASPPIAVEVISKENSKSYRNQFMFMWKSAKN